MSVKTKIQTKSQKNFLKKLEVGKTLRVAPMQKVVTDFQFFQKFFLRFCLYLQFSQTRVKLQKKTSARLL